MQQKRNNVLKGKKTKGNAVVVAVIVRVRSRIWEEGIRSLEMTLPNRPVSLIEELMDLH